jgi:hypothetical protein
MTPSFGISLQLFYGDLRMIDGESADRWIANGDAIAKQAYTAKLLREIQDGIFASDFTPTKMETICRRLLRPAAQVRND